jgi:hypothetical protein
MPFSRSLPNVVGAASLDFCLAVVSYTGARMIGGSPFGTVVAGSAQATANPSFSVSSTSTDLVAYGFGVSGAPAVTITTGTNRGSSTATTAARLVIGDVVGAATVSISATAATSNTWGFLAVPIVASAAAVTNIQFDNAAYTATAVSVNSRGMVLTATSNACLMVWTEVDGGNQTLTSVVVNSNLTAGFVTAVEYKAASIRRVELWVLTAPPSGNLTISANIKGVATASIGIGAATYTGHRTNATPFGNTTVASASATAQFAIVGSSTIGNVLVFGMGHDNNQAESPGPGLTLRVNSGGNYPNIGIYDTPGQLAATASMTSVATAYWGAIAIELIQSTVVSGNAASITDVRDTFSASGQVIVQGSLAATDTRDKFSVSGQVIVQGRMSATDVIGTFSATGYVVVSARLSATDARDKFSASGYGIVTARLSATDARDVFSASGYGIVTARLSATDVQDKFSASGQTIVAGRVSATDVVDRFSASGQLVISARLSATDVTDKFSASGVLVAVGNVNGSLAATDARDTASISGYVVVSGSINFTDHADTFAAQGITTVATPVITAQDAGSGGGHGKQQPEYFRADPAFWSLREQYLKRIHKDISAEPAEVFLVEVPVTASIAAAPIDQGPLAALRASRAPWLSPHLQPATTSPSSSGPRKSPLKPSSKLGSSSFMGRDDSVIQIYDDTQKSPATASASRCAAC